MYKVLDIGPAAQYFVAPSQSVGRTKIGEFPRDASMRRWVTKPIAPVLIASAVSDTEVGPVALGRFDIDVSAANIEHSMSDLFPGLFLALERTELVLYREDGILLNGRPATAWFNK